MTKTIEAIFENGVFKPISPLKDFSEHKKVTLIIKDYHVEKYDILSLASTVYDNLSPEDIKDIEKLAFDRSHFSRT